MKSPGLLVAHARAEETRRLLRDGGWLRVDLQVLHEPDSVVFPLAEPPAPPLGVGELVDREFPLSRTPRSGSYRDRVHVADELHQLLPRAFDVVGDVVVIRLPSELEPHAREIGQALLEAIPSARLVARDMGVHGPDRRRSLEPIAGGGPWTTVHRENGLTLDVDLSAAYFSPRLSREHARVAQAVRHGETVFDLCCGIGPFSALIAHDARARRVVAVDRNPAAAALARANLARVGSKVAVEVRAQDVEEFLRDSGPCDRAILNLPLEGIKYLPSVAATVAPSGSVHHYEVTPRAAIEATGAGRRSEVEAVTGSPWTVAPARVVHAYSARDDLVAYTFTRALA